MRIFAFASEPCQVVLHPGMRNTPLDAVASTDAKQEGAFALGITLSDSIMTRFENSRDKVFFYDNPGLNTPVWSMPDPTQTFSTSNIVTVVVDHERALITLFRDCIYLAQIGMPDALVRKRLKLVVCPAASGCCIQFVSAPYSEVRVARVVKSFGRSIAAVEYSTPQGKKKKFVTRADVRFCAQIPAALVPGIPAVYRPEGHTVPKRVTVVTTSSTTTVSVANPGDRQNFEIPLSSIFSTENEDLLAQHVQCNK